MGMGIDLSATTPELMNVAEAIAELDRAAPGVPLLALGQTVLWDEPTKAGLLRKLRELGSNRRFIAGVHDTDYFAKLPVESSMMSGFAAYPHNATTTRDLWSAAGEFSALFGSETVIKRSDFLRAGARLAPVLKARPNILDTASEAYGWRGIVLHGHESPITANVSLDSVFPTIRATLKWALDQSLDCLSNDAQAKAIDSADALLELVDRTACEQAGNTLPTFYESLLPGLYELVAGENLKLDTTKTSELLKFNSVTSGRSRFELVQLFLDPESRDSALAAYNEALEGSEIYGLDRFGTGALPFDLVIPGVGRGTLRVGNRGIVIMTPEPQFVSIKSPVWTVADLATAIERKFGPDCVLIGKAVTLIGMISREFIFVFHEGASSYVGLTRRFHELLDSQNLGLAWNPILRIRYHTWDAIDATCTWLKLPEPLQLAFGAEEMCSPSFASRWREVGRDQQEVLKRLAELRRPIDLIEYLQTHRGGAWEAVAREYRQLHLAMEGKMSEMSKLIERRHGLYEKLRELKRRRTESERAKGDHFREFIFEKSPSAVDLAARKELSKSVEDAIDAVNNVRREIRDILMKQREISNSAEVRSLHGRRRAIELEAELKRLRLIRHAVVASKGLANAGRRPSAWWFPLVSPDGAWFAKTWKTADCYFEPLRKTLDSAGIPLEARPRLD